MELNDLLRGKGIDPESVIVLRHRPWEPTLNRVLPWLAAEKPDVFNAYQQTHGPKLERALPSARYVASFIGHEAGRALYVGLYTVDGSRPLSRDEYWNVPGHEELKRLGMVGWKEDDPRLSVRWFELTLTEFYAHWKGKLVVGWPPPERSWWRRAHRNVMPVEAVLPESAFAQKMPPWDEIDLGWEELSVLPTHWRSRLSEWRGIYYIFDGSDGKGYVGSAYGATNLLGRWLNYSASGHGGNRLLRQRDRGNFRFTILQRVSPDMPPEDVIRLESSWKERLHTRQPFGLNDN